MTHSPSKSVLLIAGPTASGKSAVAIAEARARNGVVINADALQVYVDLRIITARPSVAEEAQAPHLLYGYVGATQDYSVGRWLADAMAAITQTWEQGQLPILCGGTGLYFKALLEGLAEVPPIAPEIRAKWRDYQGDLHAELAGRDARGAALLNPADRHRLVRALEVIEATGHPLRHWQEQGRGKAFLNHINVERRFLNPPREVLHARADARLLAMVAQGAIDEVAALQDLDPMLPIMKAIGVPEFLNHIRGEITRETAIEKAQAATRQYIKRQTTWWRGQMVVWESATPISGETDL
jgi:tRNA dimethylallyltransferase